MRSIIPSLHFNVFPLRSIGLRGMLSVSSATPNWTTPTKPTRLEISFKNVVVGVVGVVYSSNSDNYSPTRRQHGLTT